MILMSSLGKGGKGAHEVQDASTCLMFSKRSATCTDSRSYFEQWN